MSDKLKEKIAAKLTAAGLRKDPWDVQIDGKEIIVSDAHNVTFEMLEKISMFFGTRKINLGHEGGYYGETYSRLVIIEPSENWLP